MGKNENIELIDRLIADYEQRKCQSDRYESVSLEEYLEAIGAKPISVEQSTSLRDIDMYVNLIMSRSIKRIERQLFKMQEKQRRAGWND